MPIKILDNLGKPVVGSPILKAVSELDKHITPAKVSGTQVQGVVSTQKHSHGQPTEPEQFQEHVINANVQLAADENIIIEFGVGRTINLGNFESVKVNVGLHVPCSKAGIEAAYDWATDWVGDKLSEATKAAQG